MVTLAALALGASLVLLAACAPAAAPTPSPIPATAAPPAAKATTAPAAPPVAKATAAPAATTAAAPPKTTSSALAQVIEGAKKEAKVSIMIQSDLAGEKVKEIREGIKKNYGLDLEIGAVPSASYPAALAQAISEFKAGATPSLDFMPASDLSTVQGMQAGVIEKVDWEPLLAPGTPKEVIKEGGYGINTFQSHLGLVYDPRVIPAAEAPKSFADLGNPKWRNKIAMYNYANNYLTYAYVLGPEKFVPQLRAIMSNNPAAEIYANGQRRYMSGEYPILLTSSQIYLQIKKAGVPVEFVSPDISWLQNHNMILIKGSKVPNAARLVAAFLAGPDGHKIHNSVSRGSMLYPGNVEFDLHEIDQKAGLRVFQQDKSPESVQFFLSDKGKQVEKEIGDILQGK